VTKKIGLAPSAERVPYSRIREIGELAMTMNGVLRLYFGESNLPTPQYIKDAVQKALADGYTFYTENAGFPSLRRAVADKYRELHGVDVDGLQEVLISASGVQALNVGIRCVLDPGDEAIILTPAWPNAASIVMMCSAAVREIPQCLVGDRYHVDFAAIEAAITPRTRLLVYTSPSNPLGWVATEAEQQRLLDLCRLHGLWLMADEVYERLYYHGKVAPSILRKCTREDAVMVPQSFSKSYCMTGWRLGWLVGRHDLIRKAAELNEFIVSHAPAMTQKAGETALRDGEPGIAEMVQRLRENRDLALAALGAMSGLTIPCPDGAFYLFPRVEGLRDSFEFCRRLLLEKKVGLAPGVAFGAGGEGSIRICYAADRSVLEPALERLGQFLREG
jgi:aspartate/methionine/tyrosine aminotransferase